MATITPKTPTIAGAVAAFTATAPAGDQIVYNGGDLLIEFDNGHASAITINFVPTQTTGVIQGAGRATIPTRTIVLAAAGKATFLFKSEEIRAYKNLSNRLPITYTGGNAALLIRAFALK